MATLVLIKSKARQLNLVKVGRGGGEWSAWRGVMTLRPRKAVGQKFSYFAAGRRGGGGAVKGER